MLQIKIHFSKSHQPWLQIKMQCLVANYKQNWFPRNKFRAFVTVHCIFTTYSMSDDDAKNVEIMKMLDFIILPVIKILQGAHFHQSNVDLCIETEKNALANLGADQKLPTAELLWKSWHLKEDPTVKCIHINQRIITQ